MLGIAADADAVVIQAAYRALMRKYHPDTNKSPESQKRAAALNAAYAILGDAAARQRYDRSRADVGSGQSGRAQATPSAAKKPAQARSGVATPMKGSDWATVFLVTAVVLFFFTGLVVVPMMLAN